MDILKRFLERLKIIRLVWLTESWSNIGYKTQLRVVRLQGPRREPWCMNTSGGSRGVVRLLPTGKAKSKFPCTWEPYNERSPQFGGFSTLDDKAESRAAGFDFGTEPPQPSAWSN
jgi:hypothetical protein